MMRSTRFALTVLFLLSSLLLFPFTQRRIITVGSLVIDVYAYLYKFYFASNSLGTLPTWKWREGVYDEIAVLKARFAFYKNAFNYMKEQGLDGPVTLSEYSLGDDTERLSLKVTQTVKEGDPIMIIPRDFVISANSPSITVLRDVRRKQITPKFGLILQLICLKKLYTNFVFHFWSLLPTPEYYHDHGLLSMEPKTFLLFAKGTSLEYLYAEAQHELGDVKLYIKDRLRLNVSDDIIRWAYLLGTGYRHSIGRLTPNDGEYYKHIYIYIQRCSYANKCPTSPKITVACVEAIHLLIIFN